MSLILDALARAERDKRREAQPLSSMLADAEPAAETPARHRSVAWRVAAASAVLLGVLALALWLRPPQGGPESPSAGTPDVASAPGAADASMAATGTPVPPTASAEAGTSAVTETRSGPAVTSLRPVTAGEAATAALPRAPSPVRRSTEGADDGETPSEVAALYAAAEAEVEAQAKGTPGTDRRPALREDARPAPAMRSAQEASVTTQPSVPVQERTGAAREAELASPQTQEEAVSGATDEDPVDLETLLRDVRRESEVQGLAPHPVPLLSTLSKQFRDSVPTLMYLRHDYNPDEGSTVLLNGDTLRAGGRTRGVEVREILPDSVICSYQGTDFRLRALNSWVNL